MKQKYLIFNDDDRKELVIKEFAELDKEIFSLLCEQRYPRPKIETAMTQGKEALILALRTQNMFPIGIYAEKIAETVVNLLSSPGHEGVELYFNDIDTIKKAGTPLKQFEPDESEPVEIEDLLEDDADEVDFDDDDIDKIAYPINIASDDALNSDEED